jgi:hypothetical protein
VSQSHPWAWRASRISLLLVLAAVFDSGVAAAQDLDACIAASEKAVTLRKTEKLIEERASLSVCAASSCPDEIRSSCGQRLGQVTQTIPTIVFLAKDGSGHDLTAVSLAIDGAPRSDHMDGSAIELDPGEHEFTFQAAGQPPVVQRFVLHQGELNRRETIVIGPVAATTPTPDASSSGGPAWGRTAGLVVGGVGVASLVVGAIFGGLALSAHSSYEQNCGANIGAPAGQCNSMGVSGQSDAASKATVSTIFFIGGGVAAAGGAALFFFMPKTASTQVGVGPGSITLSGRF